MESKVLIVDDHPIVRRGLRALLEGQSWVAHILEAQTAGEAVRIALTWQADVVVMDIRLPDGNGIDATRRILKSVPHARILMLTMTDDESTVLNALRAGARGYVHKDCPPDMLVDALRTVAGGGVVLGPTIGRQVSVMLGRALVELPPPLNTLTGRERDILVRLAAGEDNARIARGIGVSEKTIRNQVSLIYTKLGVSDRVQAALMARDAGLAAD
ncbi:MAG TPA: response regulator transcription factor [Candidatus Limnocylindrales bacterium]|nr:response regulator transcription factor [Candidatus Limnocylindrales bacterium]